jgi:hypothetical protein
LGKGLVTLRGAAYSPPNWKDILEDRDADLGAALEEALPLLKEKT